MQNRTRPLSTIRILSDAFSNIKRLAYVDVSLDEKISVSNESTFVDALKWSHTHSSISDKSESQKTEAQIIDIKTAMMEVVKDYFEDERTARQEHDQ